MSKQRVLADEIFSRLVERISGAGADAWNTHAIARAARDAGADVILLSVGDPDLDSPAPVVERAIECLRGGDTHYTPATGRAPLRAAIAAQHRARSGQEVDSDNVIFLSGAQNALFAASLCLAGPGDEVIAFEPLYPTYPAALEVAGARMVRATTHASTGFRVDFAGLEALITPRTAPLFFRNAQLIPAGVIMNDADLAIIGRLAQRHSLWIVVDEVYAGLAPGGRVPTLAASLPDQVVTLSSLSKDACDAGLARRLAGGSEDAGQTCGGAGFVHVIWAAGFVQEAA